MVYFGKCYVEYLLKPVLILVQAGISSQWTTDSQRLILEDFDMICESPSYIYSFALQFSPSSSWLYQHYNTEYLEGAKVIKGPSARWGTCFRTVPFHFPPQTLTCWKDTIAVSMWKAIITLDAITGSRIAVLSESEVLSLTFSPDGTSLVSGSNNRTIKLWDIQTGGVIRTFKGHTGPVYSVSISPDCTTLASGSDETIFLWNIQTGECHSIIQQEGWVTSIHFFPLNPQHFISISDHVVWEWSTDGHKIASKYDGSCAAFSSDGSKFVSCNKAVVQVKSSDSRAVMAEFHMDNTWTSCCCFSPDGRFIAIVSYQTAYVWDITSPEPHLIETFTGHDSIVTSLVFSSPTSLVSISGGSIKFWQISAPLTSPDVVDPKSKLYTSPIRFIALQAKDGIAISSDLDGVVRIWDLLTGLCNAVFQTPAKDFFRGDAKLIDNRLVLVWYTAKKIHIWDVEKEVLLRTVDIPQGNIQDLRISGDGSKVFYMGNDFIQAWNIWTGEVIDRVEPYGYQYDGTFLTIDGSRVWVHFSYGIEGWDFGVLDSSSIQHYQEPPNRPHLDFIGGIRKQRSFLPGIEDTISGKKVLQLPLSYTEPTDAQWDGWYLVAGYKSGEVLILDCDSLISH